MQTSQTPVWARDHTIFGVCEALGEDLGFNPMLLRVPLAVCLLLSPTAVFATYAALGLIVAFSRFVSPVPKSRPAAADAGFEPAARDHRDAGADPEMALAA